MFVQRQLETLLSKGKITRREFIARMSALGITIAASPALIANSAKAAKPKKGGRFRMGMTGGTTSDTLDPATLDDAMDIHADWCVRNNLVEVDYKGNAIPELAESWDAEPGATKWVFKLRKGVEFHNGKTMTSEDVLYSLNHHRGEDSKSGAKGLVDQIEDIKADGKYEVIILLKSGNADFPYILNDYHLTIAPAGTTGRQWDDGIGTAGYVLQKWEPGVRAFFTRNPNYWKEGRAHFDEVEIIAINDDNARTNALKTKKIDYMQRVELKTAHLLKRIPGIQVFQVPGGFHYTIPMHIDVAPFDNNDVRLALKYAIDREQMIKTFLRGYGTLGNDHPILNQRFHASELPQRKFDPEKAQFHLKKAGLKSGHTFDLHASDLGGFIDVALLFKEQARKANININVIKQPEDGYWNNVWLKKPFVMCYWGARPTCDMMFSIAYSGEAPWNDTHFKHKRFDELLVAARVELDDEKRRQMYFECQKIMRDEGGAIIPFFKDYVEAVRDNVKFENVSGAWEADGHHACERWWFA
jgi:peptide/nickel transport system substrate-binding protein